MTLKHQPDGTIELWTGSVLTGKLVPPIMPDRDIYLLAARHWTQPADALIATAIAIAESGGYQNSLGDLHLADATWARSEGLWQIRVRVGSEGSMLDPSTNVAKAYALWKERGWRPWGAYTNGRYLIRMDRARKAQAAAKGETPKPAAPTTPTPTAPPVQPAGKSIVDVARGEIGYREGANNDNKYAPANGQANHWPWCASFVVWCARQANVRLATESASCDDQYNKAKAAGTLHNKADKAKPGWLVLYDWQHNGTPASHIGIVESDTGTTFTTIEGNTPVRDGGAPGDGVTRRQRTRTANVVGFIEIDGGTPSTTTTTTTPTTTDTGTGGTGSGGGYGGAVSNPSPYSIPDLPIDDVGFARLYDNILEGLGIEGLGGRAPEIAVSWSTDQVSEITMSIEDPGLKLFGTGRFAVAQEAPDGTPGQGTEWTWRPSGAGAGWVFTLSALEIRAGQHGTGELGLTFRTASTQRLRQTRPDGGLVFNARTPSGVLADHFHYIVAEASLQRAQLTVNQAEGTADQRHGETLWDAFQRWAEECGYLLFEAANTVFFGRPSWFIASAGMLRWPIKWEGERTNAAILTMPSVRHTADDWQSPVEVTVTVLPQLGGKILPGHTIELGGMGVFDGAYLVTSVEGVLSPGAPWTINARTAIDPVPSDTTDASADVFDTGSPA